jgi:hypothetical protein
MSSKQVKDLTADTSIATTDVLPIQGATGDMKKITGSNVKASLETGGGIALALAAAQVAAAGSDSHVQYSNAGVTAGDADLVWDDSGKALQIGASTATAQLKLPSSNDAATPTLAFGDGDTGLYESAANTLSVAIAGSVEWTITASKIVGSNANSPAIMNEAPSSTNPTLVPDKVDLDTGIGLAAADNLSIIAGGKELARFVNSTKDFSCFIAEDAEPDNADIPTSFCAVYMDETGNNLTFKVKYSNGSTIKSGTLPLT